MYIRMCYRLKKVFASILWYKMSKNRDSGKKVDCVTRMCMEILACRQWRYEEGCSLSP